MAPQDLSSHRDNRWEALQVAWNGDGCGAYESHIDPSSGLACWMHPHPPGRPTKFLTFILNLTKVQTVLFHDPGQAGGVAENIRQPSEVGRFAINLCKAFLPHSKPTRQRFTAGDQVIRRVQSL